MEVSLVTASRATAKKTPMARHPAPCTAKILTVAREDTANLHPATVTASPRVVLVNSPCMGVMHSNQHNMVVTLHREWQMEDTGSLLQTMAHQLAMDHPRVTDPHKDMVVLHRGMANSPNRDTDSLLVQGFVRPGTRGLGQQMEKTGAGSIVVVVYLFSI